MPLSMFFSVIVDDARRRLVLLSGLKNDVARLDLQRGDRRAGGLLVAACPSRRCHRRRRAPARSTPSADEPLHSQDLHWLRYRPCSTATPGRCCPRRRRRGLGGARRTGGRGRALGARLGRRAVGADDELRFHARRRGGRGSCSRSCRSCSASAPPSTADLPTGTASWKPGTALSPNTSVCVPPLSMYLIRLIPPGDVELARLELQLRQRVDLERVDRRALSARRSRRSPRPPAGWRRARATRPAARRASRPDEADDERRRADLGKRGDRPWRRRGSRA